jgi:hypothetical protein
LAQYPIGGKMKSEAEYNTLRQELLQSTNQIVTISIFVMTVTGALLSAALQYSNPIAALFPLFVLYLGNVVAFTNLQTVVKIGAYLEVFWEKENKDFRWETRQARLREIIEQQESNKPPEKRSGRWEQWMFPLFQRMIFVTGVLCITLYAYIFLVVLLGQKKADFLTPFPTINWIVFLSGLVVSTVLWISRWIRSIRQARIIDGQESIFWLHKRTWQQIRDEESRKQNIGSDSNDHPLGWWDSPH